MEDQSKSAAAVYQFKIHLKVIEPLIWRQFVVPGDVKLGDFHRMLQAVMGWEDSHLHMFTIQGKRYGNPADDEDGTWGLQDEHAYRLDQVVSKPGDVIEYEYDFGDSWQHVLEVEQIRAPQAGETITRCTGGERNCPPEDVGGPPGYDVYLKAMKDVKHPEHEYYYNWRGAFDSENFNLDLINKRLGRWADGGNGHPFGFENAASMALVNYYYRELIELEDTLEPEQLTLAEILPAREDMVVLLEYLRDHKVTGTQSANLPLKAAKEMSTRFVQPPQWEVKITETESFRVASSADIWTIDFLMLLARSGNLVSGGVSRRFYLTQEGTLFLEAPPVLQVWTMFVTWWIVSNWFYVVPTPESLGEQLSEEFKLEIERNLAALPVGKEVPFELFAKTVTASAQLPDGGFGSVRDDLIEDLVVIPLSDLGVISPRYENFNLGDYITNRLVAISMTRLGVHFFRTILPTYNWS
jgi:hypothetical protein